MDGESVCSVYGQDGHDCSRSGRCLLRNSVHCVLSYARRVKVVLPNIELVGHRLAVLELICFFSLFLCLFKFERLRAAVADPAAYQRNRSVRVRLRSRAPNAIELEGEKETTLVLLIGRTKIHTVISSQQPLPCLRGVIEVGNDHDVHLHEFSVAHCAAPCVMYTQQ